jgi:hypothetical protein
MLDSAWWARVQGLLRLLAELRDAGEARVVAGRALTPQ